MRARPNWFESYTKLIYYMWADIRLPRHSNVNRCQMMCAVWCGPGPESKVQLMWQVANDDGNSARLPSCVVACWRAQRRAGGRTFNFGREKQLEFSARCIHSEMETHIFEHISPRIRPTRSHSHSDHLHIFQQQSAFFSPVNQQWVSVYA